MVPRLAAFGFILLAACHSPAAEPPTRPTFGPAEGGLRLGLTVEPIPMAKGFRVRLALLNTTEREITVRADWRRDDAGELKDYLEAAASIESVPAVAPWMGGVAEGTRNQPQPEQVLKAGETLSVEWQTDGPRLKNRVTNPNEVQNPTFAFSGLYSVHVTLDLPTSAGTVRLRSNEQLVPVGGSQEMPKSTYGQLLSVDGERKEAVLGLGALHKIAAGDRFEIGSPKGMHWRLTVTLVRPRYSLGTLELLTASKYAPFREPPHRLMEATLVR